MARTVTSTYRLQLHAGFTFADAAAQVGYLRDLGVSHLYLSPILQAAPGSMHGYDVVDHSKVSDDLGGLAGFEGLVETAHAADLGVIVDVVPNHMAFVTPQNQQVWQVLKEGRDASTADWFDIDWKAGGGRIGLPVLGKGTLEVLDDGEITLDELAGEPVLRYYDHVYPVALGTEANDNVGEVLQRQHYRLTSWRDKEVLNYRRFFEVDGLIAIRVERDEVFDATHALLLELHHRGLIDGFRIDHPDGLADPTAYLERLTSQCAKGTPIWVEKILEPDERLPRAWKCSGTTGYDALRVVQSALVDPESAAVLDAEWVAAQGNPSLEATVDESKRQVVAQSLAPEVDRLTRRAREALPDLDVDRLRGAVVELLVAGEVYRAYVRPEHKMTRTSRTRLVDSFAKAIASRPDLQPEIEALVPLSVMSPPLVEPGGALAEPESKPGDETARATDFGVRLQQTWGPVMAKGIEDTSFYRWHRLVALNEVGSDPSADPSPSVMHEWAEWQQKYWPQTMTTLSTHDTKRSEDVRARLIALAGDPETWADISEAARIAAGVAMVDLPTGHLVWQTLAGVGDASDERLTAYLEKALREGKVHTAWVDGDSDYERRVAELAIEGAHGHRMHEAIERGLTKNAGAIRATILSAKLLQLLLPGVPDTYQGCEIVDLSLVDPDNRRPVDFARRAAALAALPQDDLESEKLLVTTTALQLRRRRPDLVGPGASYAPLVSTSEHLVGFTRGAAPGPIKGVLRRASRPGVAVLATRAAGRLERNGGWKAASVEIEPGTWHDLLTGREYVSEGDLQCAEVLGSLPVALLELIR